MRYRAKTSKSDRSLRAELGRLEAARRSAHAKTAEVLGRAPSEMSERTLLERQRAARKAMEEALAKDHSASDARDIAFHLAECFEEAAFLTTLHRDPSRFSKLEIKARVSDVLTYVLDHVWEAARVAGVPLPCLDNDTVGRDDDDDL